MHEDVPYGVMEARNTRQHHADLATARWLGHVRRSCLQDARELAVSIRHVHGLAICQGIHHISQSRQGPIDLNPFIQGLASGP